MRRSSGVIIPALLIFAAPACLGASATDGMNDQNHGEPQQEQHVIASPNPTVDDGKADAGARPAKVEAVKIRPAHGATAAPMKTAKSKPKPKRTRTRPQTD
jgi:hypothetical protein